MKTWKLDIQKDGGDCIYYPYTCLDCEFEGKEWYFLDFNGHSSHDGKEQFAEDDNYNLIAD